MPFQSRSTLLGYCLSCGCASLPAKSWCHSMDIKHKRMVSSSVCAGSSAPENLCSCKVSRLPNVCSCYYSGRHILSTFDASFIFPISIFRLWILLSPPSFPASMTTTLSSSTDWLQSAAAAYRFVWNIKSSVMKGIISNQFWSVVRVSIDALQLTGPSYCSSSSPSPPPVLLVYATSSELSPTFLPLWLCQANFCYTSRKSLQMPRIFCAYSVGLYCSCFNGLQVQLHRES